MTIALIMAGGRSSRMRATAGNRHKALVPILGQTMLERNLVQLIALGFNEIAVVVNHSEFEVIQFAENVAQRLARAHGADLQCVIEQTPLGTIGVARQFLDQSDHALVVNVDNLCSLDLGQLHNEHLKTGAALTVASHFEEFQIPFGQLEVVDRQVRRYLEKPKFSIEISSGIYVLKNVCRDFIPEGKRFDAPDLIHRLIDEGLPVNAHSHKSVWIDVNDKSTIAKAEQLIQANHRVFGQLPAPAE